MPRVIPIQAAAAGAAATAPADAAAGASATQFFRNYTQRQPRVPMAVWVVARVATLAISLGLAGLLIARPAFGLLLFWGLAIPVLPAVMVIAPGLWRQVCPMASLNQLPRLAGFGRGLDLPDGARSAAFGIAAGAFVGIVMLRAPLLNHQGTLVGIGVLAALAMAFVGGSFFKGRSGWCGTFCPLAPIQRSYGQAPMFVVRNGYCSPCVGCQKSCYDFNPRAAVFADVYDNDPRVAAQRRLFMGVLPGLILGYFVQGAAPPYGEPWQALIMLGSCCASAGLYALAVAYLPAAPANPFRVALGFAAIAITAFYWFSGPTLVHTVASLLGADPAPLLLLQASRGLGLLLALALAAGGLRAEVRWRRTQRAPARPAADAAMPVTQLGAGRVLRDPLARAGAAEVSDRGSGISFRIAADATLLEGIEQAGLKIRFGCRAGVCGADPVTICAGAEHLSAAGDDELATLRRLGLEGRARLACMCTVRGPVQIDRDPHSAPPPSVATALRAPVVDRALAAQLRRVVIVGDGVAGMGVADALRRASPSVQIDLVANEPQPFYNRMGIGRLVYDSEGMDSLKLVADDWAASQRVSVWRPNVAARIDRPARRLLLADGQSLAYDKLVLATGARASLPEAGFLSHPNAFVLRSAADAEALREYVKRRRALRAVVLGGGVLGVEAADALHKLGIRVTLLQRADRLMNAQLDAPGAARLATYLEGLGIQVVCNASVLRFEGEPALHSAWLAHGPRVRADVFVAALGIQANTFLAEQAGLELGANGVRVDALMRSSDPDILAVGDVAELKGTPRGLWSIGAAHAATAVLTMLGDALPYASPRIVLQLKCEGIDLRSQGEILARDGDEEFHARPDAAAGDGAGADDAAWWRLIVRHGQLAGGLYVGPPGSAKAFTRLLQRPVDLGPIRAELRAGRIAALGQLQRA